MLAMQTTLQLFKVEKGIEKKSDFILLKTHKEGWLYVPYKNVMRLEAAQSYTLFYFTDGTKFLCSHGLNYYFSQMDHQVFQRVHKSHVINVHYIIGLNLNDKIKKIVLYEGTIIDIARRKVPSVVFQYQSSLKESISAPLNFS